MSKKKVLVTGATGYIASLMLPEFRDRYELVLTDVSATTRSKSDRSIQTGEHVPGVITTDLLNFDRTKYASLFENVEAVVHLGYRRRDDGQPSPENPRSMDSYFEEKQNVDMAYNVLRAAYEAGVKRFVCASSNHASDWYEFNLIHERKLEVVDPLALPLADNFYGWAKAAYEHMGFLFACGAFGRKMEVVMVRIGSPVEVDMVRFGNDARALKRSLGAHISPRDITQLFIKGIEAPNIENVHGVPWQVVFGVSNNTRAFWSLENARQVLGYQPEDDSEVKYAPEAQRLLAELGEAAGGRLGGNGDLFPKKDPS